LGSTPSRDLDLAMMAMMITLKTTLQSWHCWPAAQGAFQGSLNRPNESLPAL
jgi:hypothetical protein